MLIRYGEADKGYQTADEGFPQRQKKPSLYSILFGILDKSPCGLATPQGAPKKKEKKAKSNFQPSYCALLVIGGRRLATVRSRRGVKKIGT